MGSRSIEEILQTNTQKWMALEGVVGTAIGKDEGRKCIKIFTCSNFSYVRLQIPDTIDEYVVLIEKTDQFQALE